MGTVHRKVQKLLKSAFPPPATVDLQDEDGVFGRVISSRFRGLDSIDRVNLIWDVLDNGLSQQERKGVVTILAMTPEEAPAHAS